MPLQLLSPRLWLEIAIAAVIVGSSWYLYHWVYERGAQSVQVKWDAERAEIEKRSAKVSADALATTKTLAATIDKQRSESNAQIATLNTSLATAINGLSNRPSRSGEGSVPGDTSTGTGGCTGRELFREDSEFLTRESARADRLAVQLRQCKAAYQSARDALNK